MSIAVGFLIFPDFQLLDVAGPLAAFEAASALGGSYRLELLAASAGPIRSSSGAVLEASAIEAAPPLDTLVISGGDGARRTGRTSPLIDYVRRTAAMTRRTASICTGAYILAEAGLLDGKRATTHWSRADQFARRFPNVRLEADRIFVRDGTIWTSAGITAGIDLSLALIAEDVGETTALKTAQQLVVYYRRPGGQSQFSALLDMDRSSPRFGPLMGWMREHLREDLPIERLAHQVAMSRRNFSRAFVAEIGVSPARAVQRLRLESARARIEGGRQPIERIAIDTGFRNAERMRRAFIRAFGQPPQSLRRMTTLVGGPRHGPSPVEPPCTMKL
jgi:transcriptional regulator GlxA family with amidase domain